MDKAAKEALRRGDKFKGVGDYESAFTYYTLAMRHWLRLQYAAMKKGPIRVDDCDEVSLADKLRANMAMDRWTYDLIAEIVRRPTPVSRINAELLAGIVKAMLDQLRETSPTSREAKRLAAEAAEAALAAFAAKAESADTPRKNSVA
jgi:hypothetical protein